MQSKLILKQRDGMVQILSLNRPEKRNALNLEIMYELEEAIEEAAITKGIRSVILKGEGKGFSSGLDYHTLASIDNLEGMDQFRYYCARFQGVLNKMEAVEKPLITALHGFVFGLGLELALAADFRIAAEGTAIAIQEVEIGLIPDVGGTTRLTRTVGMVKAKELIMTGKTIGPQEAERIHLVNEVVREENLMEAALRLAGQLNRNAPLALGLAKKLIDRGAHMDKLSFMEFEALAQSTLLKTEDVREGIMAKLDKRDPDFKGK